MWLSGKLISVKLFKASIFTMILCFPLLDWYTAIKPSKGPFITCTAVSFFNRQGAIVLTSSLLLAIIFKLLISTSVILAGTPKNFKTRIP